MFLSVCVCINNATVFKHKDAVPHCHRKPWRLTAEAGETEVSFCYEKCFCKEQNREEKVTATEYLMGTLIFH